MVEHIGSSVSKWRYDTAKHVYKTTIDKGIEMLKFGAKPEAVVGYLDKQAKTITRLAGKSVRELEKDMA